VTNTDCAIAESVVVDYVSELGGKPQQGRFDFIVQSAVDPLMLDGCKQAISKREFAYSCAAISLKRVVVAEGWYIVRQCVPFIKFQWELS
jgi:hypothetical protein